MPLTSQGSKSENADTLDILIGKHIRFRRNLVGLTQDGLAKKLGVSFQQIQKYESGQNKISASRLYHISNLLKTPITLFFEDTESKASGKIGMSDHEQEAFHHHDILSNGETTTLIRAYYEISDKKKRKTAIDMMKGLQS